MKSEMSRLEKLRSFQSHPMLFKLYNKLKKSELEMCFQFVTEREQMSKDDYTLACSRWMLDQKDRPKNYSVMWALVLQAGNTSAERTSVVTVSGAETTDNEKVQK